MQEIKVKVTLTEGYEKRFTEACLNQLRKRDAVRSLQEQRHNRQEVVA